MRPTPKELLDHLWIKTAMQNTVNMAYWLRKVWGWPASTRRSGDKYVPLLSLFHRLQVLTGSQSHLSAGFQSQRSRVARCVDGWSEAVFRLTTTIRPVKQSTIRHSTSPSTRQVHAIRCPICFLHTTLFAFSTHCCSSFIGVPNPIFVLIH